MSNNDNIMEKTEETVETEMRTSKEIFAEKEKIHTQQVVLARQQKALDKELERTVKIELKEASKRKKSKSSGVERTASGFRALQPVPIEFNEQPWGVDIGATLPRTILTKMVYDYVKTNSLQDPADKRRIFPDDNIKKLFHLKDSDELHFSNFQTYMKRLYNRTFDEEQGENQSDVSDVSDVSDTEVVKEVAAEKTKGKKNKKKKSATKNV